MSDTAILAWKIVSMFLVIVIGWFARRRNYFTADTTTIISRFTTDIALPALIFVQMLQTVDRGTLCRSWMVPLYAASIVLLGFLAGWAAWRLFASRRQAPTFIFVVGVCNWIYLPLPIAESLYGSDGVRQLLLGNVGVWIVLWTVGVAVLHGGRIDRRSVLNLLKNPGLMATLIGLALAMFKTDLSAAVPFAGNANGLASQCWMAIFEALKLLGSITIPLALVVTGAQLGAIRLTGSRPDRALIGVVVLRLLFVPCLMMALAWAVQHGPWPMTHTAVMVGIIVAAMPVAVSCSIFTERFNQDTTLAAQSILYTTLLSIGSVPLLFWIARHI